MKLEDYKELIRWLCRWLVITVILMSVINAVINYSSYGRDDSDDDRSGKRSGMAIRTDYRTGCEYLESQSGHLIPRTDGYSHHIGCR